LNRYHVPSEQLAKILRMVRAGFSRAEIAVDQGLPRWVIDYHLKPADPKSNHTTAAEVLRWRAMRDNGATIEQIMDYAKKSKHTIHKWLNSATLPNT